MHPERTSWTDERLDDLSARMDERFERLDRDIRDLRAEMNARFETVDARFDAMQRTIQWFGGGMILTFVAGFATLLLAQG